MKIRDDCPNQHQQHQKSATYRATKTNFTVGFECLKKHNCHLFCGCSLQDTCDKKCTTAIATCCQQEGWLRKAGSARLAQHELQVSPPNIARKKCHSKMENMQCRHVQTCLLLRAILVQITRERLWICLSEPPTNFISSVWSMISKSWEGDARRQWTVYSNKKERIVDPLRPNSIKTVTTFVGTEPLLAKKQYFNCLFNQLCASIFVYIYICTLYPYNIMTQILQYKSHQIPVHLYVDNFPTSLSYD